MLFLSLHTFNLIASSVAPSSVMETLNNSGRLNLNQVLTGTHVGTELRVSSFVYVVVNCDTAAKVI